jgi:hypothetical protein
MTGRRVLAASLFAILLAGAGALAAAGATDERPPTKLWSEFPLMPTTTSAPPATPLVTQARPISQPSPAARVFDTADDMPLFLVAGIAFGLAAASTALAIAVFTGIQAIKRRSWVEHTGEPEEPFEDPSEEPSEPYEPPEPPASRPEQPTPTAPAMPPPATTPVLVDVLQPSVRLSPATAQREELVVALWRGYVKSRFYATATEPDGTETTVAASPFFRPERKFPIEESGAARAAHADLTRELAELGWEPVETDETDEAFASLFRRQSSATGEGGATTPLGSGRNQNA